MLGSLGRFAGNRLVKSGLNVIKGGKINWPAMREVGTSAIFDVGFGGLYGAMTPGDLGDKVIAGTTSALGGFGGSLGLRAGLGISGGIPMMLTEGIGGVAGDFAAQPVADALLRMKGGGTTPWEKLQAQERALLEQQILEQFLRGKGGYTQDPFLVQNGLG